MPTVKEELNWLPTSVWHLTKGDFWKQFIDDEGDPMGKVKKKGEDGKADYPYSIFNPLLAERVYRYWGEGAKDILDPFAGRTTRGLVARVMGLNYEGYEIAPKTYELTRQNLQDIEKAWQPDMFTKQRLGEWTLWNADGTKLESTPARSKDLIFTCPPYWKLEQYEQCLNQLSTINDYSAFMYRMRECGANCYRVLKPGKFCVFVVNDFRVDGKFYPFHSDLLTAFRSGGLVEHDIVINQINSPFVTGVQQAYDVRRTIKMHEYILIWRKLA